MMLEETLFRPELAEAPDGVDIAFLRAGRQPWQVVLPAERPPALPTGTTTDAIRNTADLRSRVREGMAEIADRLGTMVFDRVGRKFGFEA